MPCGPCRIWLPRPAEGSSAVLRNGAVQIGGGVMSGAASTSRRCRSAMTAHRTGVPAATWSALDLLTLGSGPCCRPEARAIGMSMQFDDLGAVGVRSNRELMRVVRAAVEGRAIRTGRKRGDDSSLCPGLDGLGSDDRADVDADAGFFDMSPASAEQVTIQIRSMMERAWEYIAIAYQGRAHIALGYATWDEYVDDRVGDLGLTVPRQERGAVVQLLSRAQMSLRAIAKVLGVDVATVHRALGANESADSN